MVDGRIDSTVAERTSGWERGTEGKRSMKHLSSMDGDKKQHPSLQFRKFSLIINQTDFSSFEENKSGGLDNKRREIENSVEQAFGSKKAFAGRKNPGGIENPTTTAQPEADIQMTYSVACNAVALSEESFESLSILNYFPVLDGVIIHDRKRFYFRAETFKTIRISLSKVKG